jgi:hypothetical protein
MTSYLFTFRGPRDSGLVPETFDAWATWQLQLGARLKDRGYPATAATLIGARADATTLHGYSVIRASSLDAAVALAHGCPILHEGGGIEVAELVSNDDTFDQWLARQSH